MRPNSQAARWIEKKARAGYRGYPIGTIAFYGPDDKRPSKVAVNIVLWPDTEPVETRRWFSEAGDVRTDPAILEEVVAFLRGAGVLTVSKPKKILGCPHEEGIDYPMGSSCPQCPFWEGRDRWAGQFD